nr:replication associated protein [Flumine microvirus 14]
MPCTSPLSAWLLTGGCGERRVVFRPPIGCGEFVRLPCGKCIACRLEYSRQWAIRGVHEASFHSANCFLTLTFDDAKVDAFDFEPSFDSYDCYGVDDRTYTLVRRDFQLFMKRLRKRFGSGIRYMHCGEYGEELGRPHHHVILFGFDFSDKVPFEEASSSFMLKRSPALEELWPFGFSSVGEANFETIAYVARYVTKKVNGSTADDHYLGRLPEFMSMSRRPGIGRDWIDSNVDDVLANDFIVVRNGIKSSPPRYYSKIMDLTSPFELSKLVLKRVERAESRDIDLDAHAFILNQRFSELKRSYEYET